MIFTQRKNAIKSGEIFDYSDEFLKEIIEDLIKLKAHKLANLKNNNFENKLKLKLKSSSVSVFVQINNSYL